LIDLWRDKSGENAFPVWRDFELEDFSMWWGIDLPLMKDGELKQVLSGYRAINGSDTSRPACEPLWSK